MDLELEHLLSEPCKPLWEQLLQEPVVFQAPDKRYIITVSMLSIHVLSSLCHSMADFVKALWADPAIKEAWERRSTLQVNESFGTFVERIDVVSRLLLFTFVRVNVVFLRSVVSTWLPANRGGSVIMSHQNHRYHIPGVRSWGGDILYVWCRRSKEREKEMVCV